MFVKKDLSVKGREKEYSKKIYLWVGLGYRLDHKLLIGPTSIVQLFAGLWSILNRNFEAQNFC